uniref:Uncharacterized protein n=1 Tax=Cacopsylla melanoneura TaxID=428564 RepID=A0A8D8RIK8_9HEMI
MKFLFKQGTSAKSYKSHFSFSLNLNICSKNIRFFLGDTKRLLFPRPFPRSHSITSLDHTDGINVLIRRGPQLVFLEKAVKDIIPIQNGHPEQIGKGTFLGLKYRSTTKDISRGMRKVKRRHSSA